MKQYTAKNIRNVALAGHAGSGKTSLAEAAYYLSGASDRLGRVADGNTVCDFDPEEIRRKASVSLALLPVEWKDTKMNLLDTPGLFDFAGGKSEGFRAAGSTVIVVSGKSGVTVGAEKAFDAATKKGIAKLFFVNKLDNENADFYKVFEELKTRFGPMVCPLVVPYVEDRRVQCYVNLLEYKAYAYENGKAVERPLPDMGHRLDGLRTAINEAVAETDEELMEKYFSGEDFTPEERIKGLATGIRRGEIAPVFCGSAQELEGVDQLLNGLIWLAPWAETVAGETGTDAAGNPVEIEPNETAPVSAVVFKTVVDPFFGKITYFKVVSGVLKAGDMITNINKGVQERLNHLYIPRGKEQIEVPELHAGDIGIVTKLSVTTTCDTLCGKGIQIQYPPIPFPESLLCMAVMPKSKGDEEKITASLSKLMEEDPTLKIHLDKDTKQQEIFGVGDQHLDVIVNKLKNKFKLDVELSSPKVAYRETIRGTARVQGKHKKQSGGHGQYGDVHIIFEPSGDLDTPVIFEEKIFGGSVPKNYFPAVEKGLQDCVKEGVLAGYPMVGVKATLVDGSYHPVDSSEMAFKLATSIAFKNGIPQAKPVLLEPINEVKITVDENYMGDVIGDLNKRRGRVLGMTHQGKKQLIEAEVPAAEMFTYATDLRSMTQARGSFTMSFLHYEEVPRDVQEKIIAAGKKA